MKPKWRFFKVSDKNDMFVQYLKNCFFSEPAHYLLSVIEA